MALDELIAEHLEKYHCGECRAVSSRELERVFDIRGPDLRRVINRLRGEGIPICRFDYGYYYAETEQELQRTIRQLRSRIKKITYAERGLTKALHKFIDTGQLALPMEGGDRPFSMFSLPITDEDDGRYTMIHEPQITDYTEG